MQLKRYRRKTLHEALRAVRDDLGPDALVMSTREVMALGVRGWIGQREVEITAAAERTGMSANRQAQAESDALWVAARRTGGAGSATPSDLDRATAEITARLRATGLDAETAAAVAEAHPAEHRRGATTASLHRTIAEQMASMAASDSTYAAVEVFVGPPGVGKTTTIAKIAAQERARRGRRLSLVAADAFRVGAIEQLRLYADILGTPFSTARTPDELEAALDTGRRPILLDTAGRSPADDVARDMFRILAGRSDVRTHLVLAANTPRDLARRVFDRFEDARPSRVVLTKLDEAESLGALVPVLRERQLPISYVGTGQNVPDDLERATPAVLGAWVAGETGMEARA
jgi:flagellar biosynthesis protein FlhF